MSYAVHANKKPWRFGTLAEVRAAADEIFARKGIVVAVTKHRGPATHSYGAAA